MKYDYHEHRQAFWNLVVDDVVKYQLYAVYAAIPNGVPRCFWVSKISGDEGDRYGLTSNRDLAHKFPADVDFADTGINNDTIDAEILGVTVLEVCDLTWTHYQVGGE